MGWFLEEVSGEKRVNLVEGVTSVGRTPRCTLRLDSSYCSRSHCNIIVDSAGNVEIVDFSTNGTYVNGKCFINLNITVFEGDKIGIGCWRFENTPSNANMPIYVLRKETPPEAKIEIMAPPVEDRRVADENVIDISDDDDDCLDLDKYVREKEPAQPTVEVVVKDESSVVIKPEMNGFDEPPQFLSAAPVSSSSVVTPQPIVSGFDSGSAVQFLPMQPSHDPEASAVQFLTMESRDRSETSAETYSTKNLNHPVMHDQNGRIPNLETPGLPVRPKFFKEDYGGFNWFAEPEEGDVDVALSQSVLLDIKREAADFDHEQSFDMEGIQDLFSTFDEDHSSKAPVSSDQNDKDAVSSSEIAADRSTSSPIFIIDDDEEDEKEEEIFSIWAQKLSQNYTVQKSMVQVHALPDPAVKEKKISTDGIRKEADVIPAEIRKPSTENDVQPEPLKENLRPRKSEQETKRETRLSARKEDKTTRTRSSSKSNRRISLRQVDTVDSNFAEAGKKHKLEWLDAVPSTSKQSVHEMPAADNRFEPKRKKPEVIEPPSLPTGRGKLRGRSISTVCTTRKEIEKKLQTLRTNDRIANQEKSLKEKWHQKPSLERQEKKRRQQDIQQERKVKLRELAEKQAQKRKTESDDNKVTKKPKVKVTQKNRGAFLAEGLSYEAAKNEVLSKKIPKLKPDDKRRSSTPATNNDFNRALSAIDEQTSVRRRSSAGSIKEDNIGKEDALKTTTRLSCETRDRKQPRKSIEGDKKSMQIDKSEIVRRKTSDLKSILMSPPPRPHGKVKKSVRFKEEHETRFYIIDPDNKLERKVDCKDIPIDMNFYMKLENMKRRTRDVKAAVDYSEDMLSDILGWDSNWLETKRPEVNGPDHILMPMMQQYPSFEIFSRIVLALFKIELWHSIEQDYTRRAKNNFVVFQVTQSVTERRGKHSRYVLNCEASSKLIRDKMDFISLMLCLVKWNNTSKPFECFGIITSMRCLAVNSSQEIMSLQIELNANPKYKSFIEKNGNILIKPVTNVRVEVGIYNAVNNLQISPLGKCILDPFELTKGVNAPQKLPRYKGYNELNPNQMSILLESYQKCIDRDKSNNLSLIEGPPGTGKSRLITNLALQILYGDEVRKSGERKQILICAQSNAAVDIIAQKLLEIRCKMERDKFNLVRFGVFERIDPNVRSISLQSLVQSQLRDRQTEENRNILKHERKLLESQIEKLGLSAGPDNVSRDELQKKKERLNMINQMLGATVSLAGLEQHYPRFLERANIVCTTLSSCIKLINYTKKFDVCIIDEATQCAEPYTLIPLQFGISSLVLVGDTQQLPATVLSTVSEEKGFGTSLFTRIQKCLEGNKNFPISTLKTQYRMHPEICLWSNSYFYKNVLINDESTNTTNFVLKPYAVLSLEYKQDADSENGKFTNVLEAKFVVALVSQLAQMMRPEHFTYGIITPYAHQREYLQRKINEAGIKRITVNTIDSYQGKEKDVIIMSCVRTKGVGFLGNCQRLNVALTRARKCLFVCGNFNSLMREPVWKSLLENAKRRNLFFHFRDKDINDFENKVMCHLKPNQP